MSVLRYKLWADLRLAKSRSLLAAVNMAIGIFSVGMLFGMVALMLSNMDAAHRASQPSHINLILRGAAPVKLLQEISAVPGVAGVDTINPLPVRYRKSGSDEWLDATLMLRDDYRAQRYDLTELQAGNWPAAGQLAVENLSLAQTGLALGDSVEFQSASGSQTFELSGVLRHPFVKPPKFGGQVHFFASREAAKTFGLPAGYFRQLLVQLRPPYSAEAAAELATRLRILLAAKQAPVAVTLQQDPDRHWGRRFVAGINAVLQVMALASLGLAGALIFNTVAAHLAQQTEQIGVMKALGGGSLRIAWLYLSEVTLLAVAALAMAVPPALYGADWAARRLLALFNVPGGAFQVSNEAIIWMVGGGLAVPLLAALPPVWRASGMTVREALAHYGLPADFGANRFDRMVEAVGARLLPTLYATALGNLFRRKTRLLLTQSVLIAAGVMLMVLCALIASLNLTLDNEAARTRYALKLSFSPDQAEDKVYAIAGSVPVVQGVSIWQRLPVEIGRQGQALTQSGSLGMQIMALPAASALYQPYIEAGRWLQADDAGEHRLVLNADTAAANRITTGDSVDVTIDGKVQRWQVIGLYRWLAGNNFMVEPVYAPLETIRKQQGGKRLASYALLAADAEDELQEQALLWVLKQRFEAAGVMLDSYGSEAKLAQRQFSRNQFESVLGTLWGLAAMVAAIGGIGLSGTLSIGVLQRVKEIGVLRAIGAPSPAVFRLFALEGLLHGILAWSLSVPLAYRAGHPLADLLGRTMMNVELDYCFDHAAAGYWLLIVLTLSLLAAYWPARQAERLTIRECLAH
ncbi:FtsX-like permease family protein [Methylomonas rhizoryzae]|uniref:FtsX-like permease family protein n=1 Tax=Methylomonas rhizoryzae TaxID=2608981 RepID=UPI001232DD86|nr:FtsX-like permease family protein [Methylomonas rhizoryzae]